MLFFVSPISLTWFESYNDDVVIKSVNKERRNEGTRGRRTGTRDEDEGRGIETGELGTRNPMASSK